MQESRLNKLKELNWRRPLTPSEQAELRQFLGDRPGAGRDWQTEEALSRALEHLPPAPVSSNFTARVLAAAQRAQDASARQRESAAITPWFFRSWWMRVAAGAAMMCAGFFSFQEYHAAHVRRAFAPQQVAGATAMADLPPVEWLNNFDTIQRLDKVKLADDELLSALE